MEEFNHDYLFRSSLIVTYKSIQFQRLWSRRNQMEIQLRYTCHTGGPSLALTLP
jgi:hypothetical protein